MKQIKLTKKQLEIIQSNREIVVVSAGRGAGKTSLVSYIAIFAMLRGERVILAAPTYKILLDTNWRQVKIFLDSMGLLNDCVVKQSRMSITYGKGEIVFLSGTDPEKFRGYTNVSCLIFDEAALLHEDCFKLSYAQMRDLKGFRKKVYIVSTPPPDELHWMTRMAKRETTDFYNTNALDNTFVEESFIEDLKREYSYFPEDFQKRELWGELVFPGQSSKLFGEFEIEEYDNVNLIQTHEPLVIGLDVAGKGADHTCAIVTKGPYVLDIVFTKTGTDTELYDLVWKLYAKYPDLAAIRYDSTGSAPNYTFKVSDKVQIEPVNFASSGGERFLNARGSIYFQLSCRKKIWLPRNSEHIRFLKDELLATNYSYDESRKIKLIKKDEIREQIGRSPDRADALALAMSYHPLSTFETIHVKPAFAKW